MASLNTLLANTPVRAFVQGRPKTGKTGALVALVNAGFKLRMLDYDGNIQPLTQFVDPDKRHLVDIVQLQDKLWNSGDGMAPQGKPTAFDDGLKLMQHWKYRYSAEIDASIEPYNNEVDLGKPADWGPDHIVVIDSMTSFGEAAKRRAMVMLNKTRKNSNWRVWDFAQQDVSMAIKAMAHPATRYHLLVMTHPKEISPEVADEDDDQITKEIKQRRAGLSPGRIYPSAPGKALSQVVGAQLPIIIRSFVGQHLGHTRNLMSAEPSADTDLGVPVKGLKWPIPSEDALLAVFTAMGAYPIKENSHVG